MLDTTIGSIVRGNLKMLNSDRATNAFSDVNRASGFGLLRLTDTYVPNVTMATYTNRKQITKLKVIIRSFPH